MHQPLSVAVSHMPSRWTRPPGLAVEAITVHDRSVPAGLRQHAGEALEIVLGNRGRLGDRFLMVFQPVPAMPGAARRADRSRRDVPRGGRARGAGGGLPRIRGPLGFTGYTTFTMAPDRHTEHGARSPVRPLTLRGRSRPTTSSRPPTGGISLIGTTSRRDRSAVSGPSPSGYRSSQTPDQPASIPANRRKETLPIRSLRHRRRRRSRIRRSCARAPSRRSRLPFQLHRSRARHSSIDVRPCTSYKP